VTALPCRNTTDLEHAHPQRRSCDDATPTPTFPVYSPKKMSISREHVYGYVCPAISALYIAQPNLGNFMAAGHDVGPSVGPFFGLKFGFTWFLHRHSQGSGCGADSTLTLPTAAGPTFLCRDTARALVASREGETTKHFTYQRDTPFGVVSSVNGSFFARRSLLRSAGTLRGVWFTLSHDGIDRNKWTLLTRETANHRNCRFSTTTSTCGRLIIRNLSTHIF
jgi:hypothetical protein